MRKDGKTKEGRQRWKCTACNLRTTVRRGDARRCAQLREFLSWLLKANGQPEGHARGFRKRVSWCWSLQPHIEPDHKPHPVVMADGTHVGHGHCLLVCCDGMSGHVLAWRWCGKENSQDYMALFRRITRLYGEPKLLVSDGMRGLPTAVREAWPHCLSQRCLEHVRRDCRTDLTLQPRTEAGLELKPIAGMLARIGDRASASLFLQALNAWYERWGKWIQERTENRPGTPGYDPTAPSSWWTHKRVRECHRRLQRLSNNGELFRFLDSQLVEEIGVGALPCTSNRLEGGINSPIKNMLRNHRGMPEAHMMRACEWMCWKHSGQRLPSSSSMMRKPKDLQNEQDYDYLPGWGTAPEWNDFHIETRYPNAID